jgi:hypothetical protein
VNEIEARTKRCPILKVITIDRPEDVTISRFPHCIASDCMMWRVSYEVSDDGFCGLAGGTGAAVMGHPPLAAGPPPLPPVPSLPPPPVVSPPSPPQVNPLRPGRR